MHICFFRFGSPQRRQALQGGGGVTVVSRGRGGVKVVVSRDELERIAASVTRRQRRGEAATPPCQQQRHLPAAPPVSSSLERHQLMTRTPRSEPAEEEGASMVARLGEWEPALDGIPEEA
ncbi:hypothetical protein QOZ80_2BG0169280 [Eleusine coracana subsp. coracana]|nr:hypothetical protein QOZ80_2BG0169280 [Eleusine coracana subsp. coracana]